MRDEVKVPDQRQGEGEEEYAERLRQVQNNIVSYLVFVTTQFILYQCPYIAHQREASLGEKGSEKLLNCT